MPQPGMLLQATAELHLNPGTSWMVGDVLDEVEAGHLARCRTVLVDDGNELEWRTDELRRPDGIADDLAEAALIIASSTRGGIRT
jgi:phosphoglycolate phosphatase-like HAD superfamily hydrolase